MVSQTTNNANLQRDFTLLANQASEASAQLERGQAENPLNEAFESLLTSTEERTLVVSLVCLSAKAREFMLRWMVGADADLSTFSEAAGKLTTIRLNQGGPALLSDDAVASAPVVGECEILVEGRNEDLWQKVNVVNAFGIDQLRDEAHAYQQFCTTGHLLMVAGDFHSDLGDGDIELLSNLAGAFEAVWPTVLGEKSDRSGGWWQHAMFRSHSGALDPLWLYREATGGGGEVLSQPSSPLRDSLLYQRQVRTLQGAVGNLADRQDRELNGLKLRQSLLEGQPKPPSPRDTPSTDKQIALVREEFADEMAKMEKEIHLKSERATQPLGRLTNLMRENVSKLRLEDLDKQQSPSLTKLSVNGSHLGAVNRTIEHALRKEVTADVSTVQQRLKELVAHSTESLQDVVGEHAQFSTPPLSEAPIWRTVENLMAIGKESHIELARKGVFDVLTAGRQKVFILIMFVSLMGRMGLPNLFATGLMRAGFGLFMASVLIGSMVNAIFVWRREKELQSDKEMAKIKDSLFADGTKVIEQVEKGKLVFLRDYLRDFGKSFDKQLKRAVEQHGTRRKAELVSQTTRYEANRKMLDTQVKKNSDLGRQIGKLVDSAKKLHAGSLTAIHNAVRDHEPLSPSPPDAIESQQPPEAVDKEQNSSPATETSGDATGAMKESPTTDAPPTVPVTEPETEPSRLAEGERRRRRPSALMQRREARRQARLALQSETAMDSTDEKAHVL